MTGPRGVFLLLIASVVLVCPPPAFAQRVHERRFDFGVGGHVLGPVHFAQVNANEISFGGQSKTVFSTRSTLERSFGPDVRIGVRITKAIGLESVVSLGSRLLSTRVSGDAELVKGATATERITEYQVSGGLVARLPGRRTGGLVPFATAGVGYVRQLHEGRTLVQAGQSYYAGGGVEYPFGRRAQGRAPSKGVRLDLRATIGRGGAAIDQATHVAPAFGASLFVRF